MTSLDQDASDRPSADANRLTVTPGSPADVAGTGARMSDAAPAGRAVPDRPTAAGGGGAGLVEGQVLSAGTPVPVEWSSGAWGVGSVAGRVRPQRRPTPSRRLNQVRTVSAAPGEYPAAADGGAHGIETGPTDPAGVPMGVLIGGSPGMAESTGQGGRGPDRRVSARLLRFGSGTCQVVLPEWRPAIAVSVPTEQLQRSTGLSPEELRSAVLSVVINPEAVHDRELGLRDWQAEIPTSRGRRRGRRPVR